MRSGPLALLAAAAVVGGGGVALAQGGTDPYALPEPSLQDAEVLRLPAAAGCDRDGRVRVRFRPPAGAVFGWLSVRVGQRQAVRLTGVPRAASATVLLPPGRWDVRVAGETLGGQRVRRQRTYRRCAPGRAARPPAADERIQRGGGED